MYVLKQWHEKEIYNKEIVFTFSNCNMHRKIKLSTLLTFFSDIAGEDYTVRGLSHSFLSDKGFVFLVSSYSVNFIRTPSEGEMLTIKTWEQGVSGPKINREYNIVDKNNETVISAKSIWCVVDPNTHRILRPKKFPYKEFTTNECSSIAKNCEKIKYDELIKVAERKVGYSDIDGNGHVNNSKYGDFIIDSLSIEYAEKEIKDFQIEFICEAKFGDVIEIYANFRENEIITVGRVNDKDSFRAKIIY